MTYSLVARDPESGELGVAVQSRWFAVGAIVPWAEAGVGAVATQAFPEPRYGHRALALIRSGFAAQEALDALVSVDNGAARRQVGIIDASGESASHTGSQCVAACGGRSELNVAAQGNMLAKAGLWDAMVAAFHSADGDLANRLVCALERAEEEGGDIRGAQSAALLVVAAAPTGDPTDSIVNLRVDDSQQPVAELRRLLTLHRAFGGIGGSLDLLFKGEYDAAAEAATSAARGLPDDDQVTAWHGLILEAAGRGDEARKLISRAVEQRGTWAVFFDRLAVSGVIPRAGSK